MLRALGPIALGHLASIVVVAIAVDVGLSALTSRIVAFGGGVLMVGVHTAGTLLVAALIALLVYEFLGLRILRSAWINLDGIWAMVLLAAGSATVLTAML